MLVASNPSAQNLSQIFSIAVSVSNSLGRAVGASYHRAISY